MDDNSQIRLTLPEKNNSILKEDNSNEDIIIEDSKKSEIFSSKLSLQNDFYNGG